MMMVEKHPSIDILSDDVLLHIFSLPASRPGTPGDYDSWRVVWRWLRLVHGAHSPSPDLIVLPSLAVFDFVGSVEYLEGLVSGIHAPLLVQLHVIFRGRHSLDISQLSQFIYRAASLRAPPRRTFIGLLINNFTIHHYFRDMPDLQGQEGPRLTFYFGHAARDMSEVVRVCQQLCPLVFGVRQLTINASRPPPRPEGKSPAAQWLELLAPFESVQELRVFGTKGPSAEIAHALEQSTSEMAKEVLQALGILRAGNCEIQARRSIESFASSSVEMRCR
ncbi:hypothetical protein BC826DRAFT_1190556 [Russula brevipes]|nr:hypothetical protein BC826DRAFT_1190556 [Russula brevipes]